MPPMLMLSGVIVLMGFSLAMFGMSRKRAVVNIDDRLAHYAERVDPLEKLELEQPFIERIIKPNVRRLATRIGRVVPTFSGDKIRTKLGEAGNPSGLGVIEFMGLKYLMAIGLGGGSALLFIFAQVSSSLSFIVPLVLAAFGYMLPGIWLDRKAKSRKKEITRSLPDAIDLLTISVESGLGFDPALMRVAEKWDNSLTREFARVLSELRIGKHKREALREMAARNNVEDLNVFISAVIQADQLGVAISQVLRIQSDAMRVKRRQRAEELAHKAPIKMLFPMVLLIFPALYIIILGPAVPSIVEAFR
ncbi:MAG: type II secretion system F family protein [Chloroflexia bacterium]|nr:type II secretion system F family protein [Chloroflexia bacterium]